jgi:hypothetical protein
VFCLNHIYKTLHKSFIDNLIRNTFGYYSWTFIYEFWYSFKYLPTNNFNSTQNIILSYFSFFNLIDKYQIVMEMLKI